MSDNIRTAERVMKQKAVYWERTGYDGSGEPVLGQPVVINCRWEQVTLIYKNKAGNDAVSNSRVIVDRDVTEEGRLMLGELDDLESQSDPAANPTAYEIGRFDKIPNRQGNKFVRIVML